MFRHHRLAGQWVGRGLASTLQFISAPKKAGGRALFVHRLTTTYQGSHARVELTWKKKKNAKKSFSGPKLTGQMAQKLSYSETKPGLNCVSCFAEVLQNFRSNISRPNGKRSSSDIQLSCICKSHWLNKSRGPHSGSR